MSEQWKDKVSSAQAVLAESGGGAGTIILLVAGDDMNGNAQWAYAKIPVDRFLEFKSAEKSGNYSLSDYGEILAFGSGAKPPSSIRQKMMDQYNCNEQFEEEMHKNTEEAIAQLEVLLTENLISQMPDDK